MFASDLYTPRSHPAVNIHVPQLEEIVLTAEKSSLRNVVSCTNVTSVLEVLPSSHFGGAWILIDIDSTATRLERVRCILLSPLSQA